MARRRRGIDRPGQSASRSAPAPTAPSSGWSRPATRSASGLRRVSPIAVRVWSLGPPASTQPSSTSGSCARSSSGARLPRRPDDRLPPAQRRGRQDAGLVRSLRRRRRAEARQRGARAVAPVLLRDVQPPSRRWDIDAQQEPGREAKGRRSARASGTERRSASGSTASVVVDVMKGRRPRLPRPAREPPPRRNSSGAMPRRPRTRPGVLYTGGFAARRARRRHRLSVDGAGLPRRRAKLAGVDPRGHAFAAEARVAQTAKRRGELDVVISDPPAAPSEGQARPSASRAPPSVRRGPHPTVTSGLVLQPRTPRTSSRRWTTRPSAGATCDCSVHGAPPDTPRCRRSRGSVPEAALGWTALRDSAINAARRSSTTPVALVAHAHRGVRRARSTRTHRPRLDEPAHLRFSPKGLAPSRRWRRGLGCMDRRLRSQGRSIRAPGRTSTASPGWSRTGAAIARVLD
jgi:hypothetical protein